MRCDFNEQSWSLFEKSSAIPVERREETHGGQVGYPNSFHFNHGDPATVELDYPAFIHMKFTMHYFARLMLTDAQLPTEMDLTLPDGAYTALMYRCVAHLLFSYVGLTHEQQAATQMAEQEEKRIMLRQEPAAYDLIQNEQLLANHGGYHYSNTIPKV